MGNVIRLLHQRRSADPPLRGGGMLEPRYPGGHGAPGKDDQGKTGAGLKLFMRRFLNEAGQVMSTWQGYGMAGMIEYGGGLKTRPA